MKSYNAFLHTSYLQVVHTILPIALLPILQIQILVNRIYCQFHCLDGTGNIAIDLTQIGNARIRTNVGTMETILSASSRAAL
jgi:hypothetical protein